MLIMFCQMCKREYKQARDFRAHIATHTNSTNLQCDMCPQVLSNTDEYLNHLKVSFLLRNWRKKIEKELPEFSA